MLSAVCWEKSQTFHRNWFFNDFFYLNACIFHRMQNVLFSIVSTRVSNSAFSALELPHFVSQLSVFNTILKAIFNTECYFWKIFVNICTQWFLAIQIPFKGVGSWGLCAPGLSHIKEFYFGHIQIRIISWKKI